MNNHQTISLREKAENQLQNNIEQLSNNLEILSQNEIQRLVHELEVHQIELEMQNEELKHTQLELDTTKNRYFDLYDMAPIGYCTLDDNGLIQEANLALANLLGINRQQLIKQSLEKFIDREEQDIYYFLRKRLVETQLKQDCELHLQNEKKIKFWAHLIITSDTDSNNKQIFRLMINDISKRKELDKEISIAASVFTNTSEAVMILQPDGTIYNVNDAFTNITGYSRDEVLGKNPNILSSGQYDEEFYKFMWDKIIKTGSWSGEIWNKQKDGQLYAENLNINVIYKADGSVQNYIGLFSDITIFKNYIKDLEHIAHYDRLTELPNRSLFLDRLNNAMAQSTRRLDYVAVIFLDLDGFKDVNDTYGHDAGDQLLIALSGYMKNSLRDGDTFARIGGDEFAAVLVGLPDLDSSLPMISRLLSAASEKVDINGQLVRLTASLGVTFYPQTETIDEDHLLRQADQAMYKAKISGKNRYRIFDTEQNEFIKEKYVLIDSIKHALESDEFILYYQPKVNMRTGEVIGVEALLRWQHPQKGLMLPLDFLPHIEGHTLSIALGEWVIHNALLQVQKWQEQGINMVISVNVGARQLLEENFVERLAQILLQYPDIEPSKLEIEVLETSKLEDIVTASIVINKCKDLGVLFSLDDFGTGYSSLTYLKQLPISHIKIDQSFVKDMLSNADDLAILDAIIKLSDAFRRHVIAEGVETVAQGTLLLQLGCELGQGFIIASPMPAELFSLWLDKWVPDSSWTNQTLIDSNQLQILFAGIEHNAWVANITAYVKGKTNILKLLNSHECHFGDWLDREGKEYLKPVEVYNKTKTVHERIHIITKQIIQLYQQNNNDEALKLLDTLETLHNELLKILNMYIFIPILDENN